jgi:biopolymer transport protein ExbD
MADRTRKKKSRRAPPKPDINVTPLVDIVLVLLIIFMVVTPSLAQGETIELPGVERLDRAPKDLNPATLILAANGRTLFNQKPVNATELETRLRELHQRDPNRQILLNTDAKVPYLRVRTTLALIQRIGLRGVSLKVRPKRPDEE